MNPERYDLIEGALERGFAAAGNGKSLEDFKVMPFVTVVMGNDVEQCRTPVKQSMALYIGGMGARDKNFYNDYAKRLGYPDDAKRIQDNFLGGKKSEGRRRRARRTGRRRRPGWPAGADRGPARGLEGSRRQRPGRFDGARLPAAGGAGGDRGRRCCSVSGVQPGLRPTTTVIPTSLQVHSAAKPAAATADSSSSIGK